MNSQPRVRISPAPPLTPSGRRISTSNSAKEEAAPGLIVGEKSQLEGQVKRQSWTQVGHSSKGFLTVSEVAEQLGVAGKTVTRWCESGKLPAMAKPYGKRITYLISPAAVSLLFAEQESTVSVQTVRLAAKTSPIVKSHLEYLPAWVKAMERGLLTGKPFSSSTIEMYTYYVGVFLTSHTAVSSAALQDALLSTESDEYCKRFKMYKAVVCLGKYLIREGVLDKAFLEEAKPLYPKRHLPPKRLVVDEAQLRQLLVAAKTPFQRMMLVVLGGTGLRVSEAVELKRSDVNFEKQTLIVRLGKGNKTRTVGLSKQVVQAVAEHYEEVASLWVFSDEKGQQLTRMGLYHRLKRLGGRAGITVSPHSLRRAFVTLNANKGRPLQMLQMACGHSDIKTTMSYCMTSEQEVVEAMKGWD